jgi:hypothetical protein
MLCSSCSQIVKPVVAIDIDGTLGDYHGHFLEFAKGYLGNHMPRKPYRGDHKYSIWFCGEFGVDTTTFRQVKLAYRQGGMKRTMPVDPLAADMVNTLRLEGAELWLTTTRPYLRLDNVDPDTRFWLDFHCITSDGILYDEGKYKQLAQLVASDRVCAVLDDTPIQYDEAAEVFDKTVPILKRNTANSMMGHVRNNVATLDDAQTAILPRMENWRRNNA